MLFPSATECLLSVHSFQYWITEVGRGRKQNSWPKVGRIQITFVDPKPGSLLSSRCEQVLKHGSNNSGLMVLVNVILYTQ